MNAIQPVMHDDFAFLHFGPTHDGEFIGDEEEFANAMEKAHAKPSLFGFNTDESALFGMRCEVINKSRQPYSYSATDFQQTSGTPPALQLYHISVQSAGCVHTQVHPAEECSDSRAVFQSEFDQREITEYYANVGVDASQL